MLEKCKVKASVDLLFYEVVCWFVESYFFFLFLFGGIDLVFYGCFCDSINFIYEGFLFINRGC